MDGGLYRASIIIIRLENSFFFNIAFVVTGQQSGAKENDPDRHKHGCAKSEAPMWSSKHVNTPVRQTWTGVLDCRVGGEPDSQVQKPAVA